MTPTKETVDNTNMDNVKAKYFSWVLSSGSFPSIGYISFIFKSDLELALSAVLQSVRMIQIKTSLTRIKFLVTIKSFVLFDMLFNHCLNLTILANVTRTAASKSNFKLGEISYHQELGRVS